MPYVSEKRYLINHDKVPKSMDAGILEPILGAPPVTKVWFSLVVLVTFLDTCNIVDIQGRIAFSSPTDICKRPLDALLSFCYAGNASLLNALNLYNTLITLRSLDTIHNRSTRESLTKLGCLLMYVFFVFYSSKYIFKKIEVLFVYSKTAKFTLIMNMTFSVLSFWNIMTMNLMYYGSRFAQRANIVGWFYIHPVFFYFLNLTPILFSSMWPLTIIMFIPGHILFFIGHIVPKINQTSRLACRISPVAVANVLILGITLALIANQ